jgi:hypothetical protein
MGQFCLVPHGRGDKNCTRTNGTGEKSMAQSQDITAAKQTYEGFIRLIKISTPIIAILAAFIVTLSPAERSGMAEKLRIAALCERAAGKRASV